MGTLSEKTVVLILSVAILLLSVGVGGSFYIKMKEKAEYAQLYKGSVEVAEAFRQYTLDKNKSIAEVEQEIGDRTLAEYLIDEGGDKYLKAIPRGVPELSGGDRSNMWKLEDGYIVTLITSEEECLKKNKEGGDEYIPLYSDGYNQYAPCAKK